MAVAPKSGKAIIETAKKQAGAKKKPMAKKMTKKPAKKVMKSMKYGKKK